jgi:hypothetical protein
MSSVTSKSLYLGKEPSSERKSLKQSISDFTINDTLRVSIDRKIHKRASAQLLKPIVSEAKNANTLNSDRFFSSNYKLKQITNSNRKKSSVSSTKNEGTVIERKDAFGNIILKGQNKKHRISFQDEISSKRKNDKKFIDIVDIQSYKKYNSDNSGDIFKKRRSGKCACFIF